MAKIVQTLTRASQEYEEDVAQSLVNVCTIRFPCISSSLPILMSPLLYLISGAPVSIDSLIEICSSITYPFTVFCQTNQGVA